MQELVRALGLLHVEQTPCGQALSVLEAHTLMLLLDAPEPPTQKVIAARLGVDKSTVTRMLRRLESKGWVQTAPSAEDGRAREVSLTESGQRTATTVEGASHALFADVARKLAAAGHEDVTATLQHLTEAIGASRGDDP